MHVWIVIGYIHWQALNMNTFLLTQNQKVNNTFRMFKNIEGTVEHATKVWLQKQSQTWNDSFISFMPQKMLWLGY